MRRWTARKFWFGQGVGLLERECLGGMPISPETCAFDLFILDDAGDGVAGDPLLESVKKPAPVSGPEDGDFGGPGS